MIKFKELFVLMTHKNPSVDKRHKGCSKKNLVSKKKLIWNVYGDKGKGEHIKRFHVLHYVLKFKCLIPLMWVLDKLFGKYLKSYDGRLDENWNVNLKIFDRVFDKSCEEWYKYYIAYGKAVNKCVCDDCWRAYEKGHSVWALKMMKRLVLAGADGDTAYREFLNILLHNLAFGMLEEYKGKSVEHLFYTDQHIYDVTYRVWWNQNGTRVSVPVLNSGGEKK